MAIQFFTGHDSAFHRAFQPRFNDGTFDVVVVNPAFVAGVVRRVNVDALHLPGVVRQQRLERDQIVALHNEIARARLAHGKLRHVAQQMERNGVVMIHNGFFSDPIEGGHGWLVASQSEREIEKRRGAN